MVIQDKNIAIVGYSFKFPKISENSSNLWETLTNRKNVVSTINSDRFSSDTFVSFLRSRTLGEKEKFRAFSAGVIPDIYDFDASFFSLSPKETVSMDPQQRLLLEMTWEALEDAQIVPSQIRGSNTAVFVGAASTDMAMVNSDDVYFSGPYTMTGNTLSIISNRVSYFYDLHGPSMTIDTACSSSLVALNEACKALKNGSADMAVVGGVNVLLSPLPFVGFSKAHMLSPDGRCKVFDEDANGYVRSEGGAVVIIKPLEKALKDGNKIHAIIRETEVNSDGKTNGITLPNGLAQQKLLKTIYKRLGRDIDKLAYVEAHGTGTPVGDPIEVQSIGSVLGRGRKSPLLIGSVKGNLGHLETASGMAGLVKAILVLQHGRVPAQVNLNKLNSRIDFNQLNVRIPLEEVPLPDVGGNPIVGVNSFGFGGTNAHVVLEKYSPSAEDSLKQDNPEIPVQKADSNQPLIISAKSERSLRLLAGKYAEFLNDFHGDMNDVIASVQNTRTEFALKFLVRGNTEERKLQLLAFSKSEPTIPNLSAFEKSHLPQGKCAFVFSGNGGQWEHMGSDLYRTSDAFRQKIDEIDKIFSPLAHWSIAAYFEKPADQWNLSATEISQPLLFAYQVGVAQILREEGVVADFVVGHSVGEVAAAWYCAALSLEDAVKVIHERSFLQAGTKGEGAMAAARLKNKTLSRLLNKFPNVEIAGHNTGGDFTLAGQKEDLTALSQLVIKAGGLFVHLPLDYPFHSSKMDPIKDQVIETLSGISPKKSDFVFVSTVTGTRLEGKELTSDYWWKNIRQPVMFKAAIENLLRSKVNRFAEIGPHAILTGYIRSIAKEKKKTVGVYALQRKETDANFLQTQVNKMLAAGWAVKKLRSKRPFIDLPKYQWDKQTYKPVPTIESAHLFQKIFANDELGYEVVQAKGNWDKEISLFQTPWLAGHKIDGSILYPASGFLMAAISASLTANPNERTELVNVSIQRPMLIPDDSSLVMRTSISDEGSLSVSSREVMVSRQFNSHLKGRAVKSSTPASYTVTPFVLPIDVEPIDINGIYQLLDDIGYQYGQPFRVLESLWKKDKTLYGKLKLAAETPHVASDVVLLDGVFHVLLASLAKTVSVEKPYLPVWFDTVRYFKKAHPQWVKAEIVRISPQTITANFAVFDDSHLLMMELNGAKFRRMPGKVRFEPRWYQEKWYGTSDRGLSFELLKRKDFSFQKTCKFPVYEPDGETSQQQDNLINTFIASTIYNAVKNKEEWLLPENIFTDAFDIERSDYAYFLLEILESFNLAERNEKGEFKVFQREVNLPGADLFLKEITRRAPYMWPTLCKINLISKKIPEIIEGSVGKEDLETQFKTLQHFAFNSSEAISLVHGTEGALSCIIRNLQGETAKLLKIGLLLHDGGERLTPFLGLRQPNVEVSLLTDSRRFHSVLKTEFEERKGITVYLLEKEQQDKLPDHYFDVICKIAPYTVFTADIDLLELIKRALKPGGGFLCCQTQYKLSQGFVEAALTPRSPNTSGISSLLTETGFEQVKKEKLGVESSIVFSSVPEKANPKTAIEQLNLVLPKGRRRETEDVVNFLSQRAKVNILRRPLKGEIKGRTVVFSNFGTRDKKSAYHADLMNLLKSIADGKLYFEELLIVVGHSDSPSSKAIQGIIRTAKNEISSLNTSLILLESLSRKAIINLTNELLKPKLIADELLVGESEVFISKVSELKFTLSDKPVSQLVFDSPGRLDNLYWKAVDRKTLLDDEVRIKVMATGLNFRDVLWSMGLLPDEALEEGFSGPSLGLEASGVVIEKGKDVKEFEVGDNVIAFAKSCFSTEIITKANTVYKKPESLTHAMAASIPVAFFTAWYAIRHLARAKRGESILIHGAAGGVGLAAIQISQLLGLEVYATAGSELKRTFLKSMGVKHVYNSRTLEFASEIKNEDGGTIDIVLNSLAGQGAEKSLDCLSPFGRFLELGKRDFYSDNPLYLRPFRKNLSYFGIDVDQLLVADPVLARALFCEIIEQFENGHLQPLPISIFSSEDIQSAFQSMQASEQIGKIVITYPIAEQPVRKISNTKRVFVRENATYLITGALGGLGKKLVSFMVDRGANSFVLISRHGVQSQEDQTFMNEIKARGTEVQLIETDVSDSSCLKLIENVLKDKKLKGILHAAGTLSDAAIVNQTAETFEKVWKPKVIGLENLDKISRDLNLDLDWFIAFSSATVLFGNPGQANYVSANMGLEAVMTNRWKNNLPGSLIGLGPVGDVGMLASNPHAKSMLERLTGASSLTSHQICCAVEKVAELGIKTAHYLAVNWENMLRLPSINSQRFSELHEVTSPNQNKVDFLESLNNKSEDEKRSILSELIARNISLLLGIPTEEVDIHKNINSFGLDSLLIFELIGSLEKSLKRKVPVSVFSGSISIEELSGKLLHVISGEVSSELTLIETMEKQHGVKVS